METNERYSELLFKYFTGELSNEEATELLLWLKQSEEHKKLLSEMSDWWAIAHIPLFKSDVEDDFKEYFDKLLEKPSVVKIKKTANNLIGWRNIAATLFLLIAVGGAAYLLGKQQTPESNHVASIVETSTFYGMQSKVILPDSSVVFLNSGSVLRYSTDYNSIDRRIELQGEACFEVKTDSLKPFFVNSGALNVCVKGTTFNVNAYAEEETIDVVLISGKVDVLFADHPNEETSLLPNQQLSYNKTTDHSDISIVNASESILWTKGVLFFSEKSFPEIARMLSRKYDVDIAIHSAALKKEVFSGSFSSLYSLDQIIREIDMDKKYQWHYQDNKLIITDK